MDKKTNNTTQRKEIDKNKKEIDKFVNSTIESAIEKGFKKSGIKYKKEK